jgi:hypothetical protein
VPLRFQKGNHLFLEVVATLVSTKKSTTSIHIYRA